MQISLGVLKKNPSALKREVATRPDALPRTSVTEIFRGAMSTFKIGEGGNKMAKQKFVSV
ncbi:hypothetical protein CF160_15780 [Enterococcus pseudoavium]|nr:hypothetical protein CF160_15780 [Enterococcus pseudoavium]